MLLTSINLNKRLGAHDVRARFAAWLWHHQVKGIVAQEPFKPADRTPPALPGFIFAGGNGHLATWISEEFVSPPVSTPEPWVQRVELAWLTLIQVHLDAYTADRRAQQITTLRELAVSEGQRPLLVCGDFNLAPRPEDGMFGDRPSNFTADTERRNLQKLIETVGLVDTTADDEPTFTFERTITGIPSRFRCDLALFSDHLAPSTAVRTDAAVRSGPEKFTDHSALLIGIPITLEGAEPTDVLFPLSDLTGVPQDTDSRKAYRPHKTAMSRTSPSPTCLAVAEFLIAPLGIARILDHGCGRGADVAHYRSLGAAADGFDPHADFGWPRPDNRDYDLVTSVFVLNVLADPWQRIRALTDAASFVRPGGHVVVVTRSPEEISKAAHTGGWPHHHDGYWSSEGKGTFQRGIDPAEIIALARRAGLVPANGAPDLALPGACHAILTKPETG